MSTDAQKKEELESKLQAYVGQEIGPATVGLDLVNEPMIRHWCDALDDRNPAYTDRAEAEKSVHGGIVAPPTMLQAWILGGMNMVRDNPEAESTDRQLELHALLSEAGYPSVVATNCDQEYTRYLRPGDQVSATTRIESISEEKATALGIGYFINTRTIFRDQNGEELGWMTFRVLKFKPGDQPQAAPSEESGAPAKPRRLRPTLGHDNRWWWDAIDRGEFLVQKCSDCGVIRHPARPMCSECRSLEWETTPISAKGTVYSYVVIHHPPVPGYDYPLVCAVLDLEDGIRFVSNIVDCDPNDVHIGMRVEGRIEAVDDEMNLPLFRPVK